MKSLMLIAFLCLFSVTTFATVAPITGYSSMCMGGTLTLTDSTPGGTWSSADPTIATVGSSTGVVTSVAPGTTTISYTVGAEVATLTVIVNPLPYPYTVAGGGMYCAGGPGVNIMLMGSWIGTNYQLYHGASAVGTPITGTSTTISFGPQTAVGTYSVLATDVTTGCTNAMAGTATITLGAGTPTITGMGAVCPGSSISLSASVVGGTWSSSNVAIAIVDMSGVLTGITPGTTTITYMAAGYCPATAIVTVTPSPVITGSMGICNLTTTTLSASPAGGTWVSSAPSIGDFTTSTSGIFTGAGIGTTTITYTAPSGCVATRIETVAIAPPPVAGTFAICDGSTTTLTCGYPGGTWTSSFTYVAAIGLTSGVVAGVTSGTTIITYTLSTGCVSTRVITVNPLPAAITGTMAFCLGNPNTLMSGTPGGTWMCSPATVATIGSTTGAVTGVSPGIATITYTVGTGCFTIAEITVNPIPSPITGALTVCQGITTSIATSPVGGIWSISSSSIAAISATSGAATAVVTGVGTGTATVTYTLGTGCTRTSVVTVNPLPTAILGILTVCSGATTTLMDATTGGTWSSSSTTIATVGSASGVVTGGVGGTATITYTLPTGCYRAAVVTVNPTPTLSGSTGICTGATTTLTASTGGGTWTSVSTGVATVDASGVVSGLTAGTSIISYASTACGTSATIIVTVSPSAAPITGTLSLCAGSSSTLADATGGGTWSIDAGGVATISGAGVLTGATPGTTIITYAAGSCTAATAVATIYAMPSAISGTLAICASFPSTLTATPGGGTWSSSWTPVATVSSAGVVVPINPGTTTISYVIPGGCYSTAVATVNPNPALTGVGAVCAGATITVNTSIPGGSWAIAPSTIASITGAGIVTGTAAGTATISYASPAGCGASRIVTVNSACSGTLSGGTATAGSGAICGGGYVSISLSGSTTGCGISLQWQSSPDGTTWTDIAGATNSSIIQYPTSSTYYRCATICAGGATVYSTSTLVGVIYSIAYHTVMVSPDSACTSAHFYIQSCGSSTGLTVTTWFGDGTSATTALTPVYSSYQANVYHAYAMSGTYTVKQVLYNSGVACDSVTFSYEKVSCQTMPVWYYKDNNTNCVLDAGDWLTWSATATEVDSAGTPIDTIYATTGFYYTARGPVGTVYGFRALSVGGGGYSVLCPSTGVLYDTVSSMGITAAKYFGLHCSSTAFDLSITDANSAHPTFGNTYLSAANLYCVSTPHTVTAHISPRYTYSYAVPVPTTVSGNTLTWNYTSSSPSVSEGIYIAYTAVSFITPGDTVHMDYSITPTAGDVNTANNYIARVCTVTGSYDPNIISVTPEANVLPCTTLKYSVMFQNDGNDTAHNIHVLDTLSTNLDESSLQVLSSSAAMAFSTLHSGSYTIIKFDFPNINLLDSSYHDQCTGTFSFSIKAKSGLADGVAIPNQVGIYFDDNPVVMTNNVTNTIGISPITGPDEVCAGGTIALADATPGGVWSAAGSGITVGTVAGGAAVIGGTAGAHTISYTVTSSCASKTATKTVTVNATVSPSVTATVSPGFNVCVGTDVTLTPTPVYGGSAPTYEWIKDGVLAGTGATYTYAPVSSHHVICRMTSNYTCRAYDTVSSPDMIQIGEPHYIPTITVTVAPAYYVTAGTPVTFTASGYAPAHQWYLNNVLVPGATGADWTTASLNEGDSICCHGINNIGCLDSSISCTIIHVTEGVAGNVTASSLSLVPNPNNGSFALKGKIPSVATETTVTIQNVLGQTVFTTTVGVHNGSIDAQLVLPADIANGVYIANMGGGAERRSIHFVLKR